MRNKNLTGFENPLGLVRICNSAHAWVGEVKPIRFQKPYRFGLQTPFRMILQIEVETEMRFHDIMPIRRH